VLIFVPTSAGDLAAWARSGLRAPVDAVAPTPGFLAAFGLASPEDSDAEHTALHVAALVALLDTGVRLVAVAESVAVDDSDDDLGRVRVGSLPWASVTALFADEPDAADSVARATSALAGVGLDEAWEHPAAVELHEATDLLWHGPGEWAALVGE